MSQFSELTIYQGADYSDHFIVTDDVTGLAANVTGYVFTSNAKVSSISPNVAFSFTLTINDGPNGNVGRTLSSGISANVNPGRYVFDVKSNLANTVSVVYWGNIDLLPGIT